MKSVTTSASAKQLNGTWISLLLLTCLSYALAESAEPWVLSTALVLGIAYLKTILIGSVFMDLYWSSRWLLAGFMLFFACLGVSLVICFR